MPDIFEEIVKTGWVPMMKELAKLSDALGLDDADWSEADEDTLLEQFDPWTVVKVAIERTSVEMDNVRQERDHFLWFLAELINERETKKEGYSMPVRWLCLREDLVQKYIEEARVHVADWWADEQAALLARETHAPYIAPNKRVQADAPSWDCQHCDNRKIGAAFTECPNCGAARG